MNLAIIDSGENSELKKVNGEFLASRIIQFSAAAGIQKVFCVLDVCEKEFYKYLSETDFGVPVKVILINIKDTIDSLLSLVTYLGEESFCLATYSTVLDNKVLGDFLSFSEQQEDADGILAITRYEDEENPLCVALNEDGTIMKFSDSKDGYGWAAGGLFYVTPALLKEVQTASLTGISGLRSCLRFLIRQGFRFVGFSVSKIAKLDHFSDIKKAEKFLDSLKP